MATTTKAKPAKKKAASGNPDFKRIKAKVGKKAPKKANDTDTSFKAVSLKVSEQSVDQAKKTSELSQNELHSTRGRSIIDLTIQLQHPAAAVRRSAAKGLKDIVSQPQTDTAVIQAHLSAIVPTTAKCCVDEENDVRDLGLSVLQTILDKLGSSASTSLRPYSSLLLAFVASAMNSLDHETRALGAVAVDLLSRKVPSLVADCVGSLLPAMTRLLSDRNLIRREKGQARGTTQVTPNKKRGREGQNANSDENEAGRVSLLKALVALLETQSTVVAHSQAQPYSLETGCIFSLNENCRNAMFIQGNIPEITDIQALEILEDKFFRSGTQSPKEAAGTRSLSLKAKLDLWSKLRDVLVEVTQKDQEDEMYLAPADTGICLLVVKAMRLFWSRFKHEHIGLESTDQACAADKIGKVITQVSKLVLSLFPISGNKCMYEMNAEICLTVLTFGARFVADFKNKWMERITDYIVKAFMQIDVTESQTSSLSGCLLDVLVLLLLSDNRAVCEGKHRTLLVRALISTFFSEDNISKVAKQSIMVRRAVGILCGLFSQVNFELGEAESLLSIKSVAALKTLSAYLFSWGCSYPTDTANVISLMHDIVRRNVEGLESVLSDFRGATDLVFQPMQGGMNESSMFEHYPYGLQLKVLCLVVLLEAPFPSTIENLARVCGRSRMVLPKVKISPKIASFAVNAIHSIRKTITVKAYLSFLLDSTGMVDLDDFVGEKKDIVEEEALQLILRQTLNVDQALRDIAFCLHDCGAIKVFPLIESVLRMLLSKVTLKEAFSPVEAIQARGAIALLAFFSFVLKRKESEPAGESILLHLSGGIEDILVEAMVQMGSSAPTVLDNAIEFVSDEVWLRPLFVLLSNEDKLVLQIFNFSFARLSNTSIAVQVPLLKFLLSVVKCPELSESIKAVGWKITQPIRDFASACSSDEHQGLAERILIELELLEQIQR